MSSNEQKKKYQCPYCKKQLPPATNSGEEKPDYRYKTVLVNGKNVTQVRCEHCGKVVTLNCGSLVFPK